ncbi:PREDICTED: nephronectin isoform X7 [Odobenus rosmarus divergens]|uniref:Nephronectin n=1 Tax=Odobenus rosmarus divergens TaxID=9708 RepID=A0A2U3W1R9_ODORO|nr:PREDICTED: nephronectin isoform X7 [Odobenus rosmarus divergens]
MDFLLALVLGSSLCLQAAAEFDVRWPRQIVSSIGLCRYGGRIDCCWGWARRSWGQCQPVCRPQCKHGECIGPDKCKCHPGYAGKTCSQDLNECGLKPRPCKHRCMNTYGSYKCYCLNGYMLMPDGSCSSALTCSMANCQYGCDVVKGQIRCQCPSPGLQLAPDGRTCVDVDECATGSASCPRFRQCVNTFGSYICKCQKGFDLMYIGGKYQCHDIDECSLGQYHCSRFARCYNVHGSYKCQCKDGYEGDGLNCVYIPKVMIEPSGPIHVPKGNGTISKGDGGHSNWIPDVGSTRWPLKTPYIPPVITNRPTSKPTTRPAPRPTAELTPPPFTELGTSPPATSPDSPSTRLTPATPIATTSPRWITVDNRIHTDPQKPRGDVFSVLIHSCNFDHGLCGWIREKDSDLHWEPVRDPTGGQYLTVSGAKGPGGKAARLVLSLGHLMHSGDLCLSFRHKVTGLHSGALQVFVRKHSAHGAALWGRNGGHGWRHTQITLQGADVKSVIFRGEKRRGHTGEIGLDDVSLRKGHCSEEREQLPN